MHACITAALQFWPKRAPAARTRPSASSATRSSGRPCSRALQKYGKLTYDEGKDTILLVPQPEEEEEVEEEEDGSWDEPVPA